ncbi:MAG TPA: hypothetical protein PKD96_04595 [Candidatus Absconditabacterales bacterium]|nr:hypothetical protein [Candidatus Absconditabacterales bacterium]HMT27560.1 hypothetical protein [Candidatus Absconditabacterales bacterium]
MRTLILMVVSFVLGYVVATFYNIGSLALLSDGAIDQVVNNYSEAISASLSGAMMSGSQELRETAKESVEEFKQSLYDRINEKKAELKEEAKQTISEKLKSRVDELLGSSM